MRDISDLRLSYGECFASELPDGLIVPWKPLSIEDYLNYTALFEQKRHLASTLENEIFLKCVVDSYFTNNINRLKAGIVGTVVSAILLYSFPTTPEEIETVLIGYRQLANNLIGELIAFTCQAFPSYTPDDLLKCNFTDFMYRVALAEKKLISTGIITEPLSVINKTQKNGKSPEKHDTRHLKEQFEQRKPKEPMYSSNRATVITADDIKESTMAYTGHELMDKMLLEDRALKETVPFYSVYTEQMQRGEKVRILSVEERKELALQRSKQYEKDYLAQNNKPVTLEEHKAKKREKKLVKKKR